MNNNNSLIDLETARARHPSRSPSGAGLARRRKGRERMVQPDQRLQDRRDESRRLDDQDVQHDLLRTARRRGGADAGPSRQERGGIGGLPRHEARADEAEGVDCVGRAQNSTRAEDVLASDGKKQPPFDSRFVK